MRPLVGLLKGRLKPTTHSATVAGDRQVRIFDIGDPPSGKGGEVEYNNSRSHLLLCHEDRVKRLVTEESPDIFLTVSEVLDWRTDV